MKLESPAFTPRNVTKYVVNTGIKLTVASLTRNAIVDHTEFDEDDKIVNITAAVVGWGVSDLVKPQTDKIVDKVADKVAERRAQRADKKQQKDNTPSE